jgi:hypothetical protein
MTIGSVVRWVQGHRGEDLVDDEGSSSSPFRGVNIWERVLPFAVVAVAAEASLLLPPGPQSMIATWISLVLLLAAASAFLLPWDRLPRQLSVLVPLAYTGSVLALVLATRSAVSGLGVVLLVPVVWTALFHRPWESVCVVFGVIAAEVVTSYVPIEETATVVARRVFFWMAISIMISVAIHGLRSRSRRAQREVISLREREAVELDRDRIAARVRESTIRRVTSASLNIAGFAGRSTSIDGEKRIRAALGELDQVIVDLRNAVFDTPGVSAAAGDGPHPSEVEATSHS